MCIDFYAKISYNSSMKHQHIAILDFGSQYMHLISRRIRQLGVLTKIYPSDVKASELKDISGVILSGGPNDVNEQSIAYDPAIFDLPVPVLGLCYGHQLMADFYGGEVKSGHESEYGLATITVKNKDSLFKGVNDTEQVWMSHWDSVASVPEGFEIIASSEDAAVSGMADTERNRYGLQFHVEVAHTKNGLQMLKNFVLDICNAEQNWSMEEYLQELRERIKEQVGDKKVFLLVSGGVDSSVAFALLEDILGKERVFGLHIDNGFMRKNESQMVHDALADAGFDDLRVIDASDRFLLATEGMTDPEVKRRKVGQIFLDAQKDVFTDLEFNPEEWLLGQGTIYPDTIESGGTKASQTIKTHHNRIPEIMEMIEQGRVIEPLAELYKDEVRALGRELGLPANLLERWPFPGPGLSIRALCSDGTSEDVSYANEQLQERVANKGIEAAVMPVQSVGVQGDQRSYQHPAVLFGNDTISWEHLHELSVDITNGIAGINRVVYHVGGDVDFGQMKLKEGYLTRDRLDVLREAEAIMTEVVEKHDLYEHIWQFPVIIAPVTFGNGGESIILRPIESEEAMTVNFYEMEKTIVQELAQKIVALDGVDAVFYDVTNKPPATIEWE